jgi:lysophospholipase L1-like esterase
MRCYLRLGFVGSFLAMSAVPSLSASRPFIEWELANRFRLFKDEAQFRSIAGVFASLPEPMRSQSPSFALETDLELRAARKQLGSAFGDPATIARFGWAAAVARKTCFQEGNRSHRPCLLATGDQFLDPKHFDIIARLRDFSSGGSRDCTWSLSGQAKETRKCDQEIRMSGLLFEQPFSIAVTESGTEVARSDGAQARSIVILGMGDSFASGEGNPDRPVVLGDNFDSFDRSSLLPGEPLIFGKVRQYPLRLDATPNSFGPVSAAVWVNTQCHRSLYAQQLKASLQVAIEEPHIAVTFLGYACTGADVYEGLLGFWKARSDVASRYFDAAPQLIRYLRDVCRNANAYLVFKEPKRGFDWRTDIPVCADKQLPKVDAVLLSIGGNDIGFSNVIVNEVVDSGKAFAGFRKILYALWRKEGAPISIGVAEQRAQERLPGRFKDLAEAMTRHIEVQPSAVIQTVYPQLTKRVGDETCGVSTDGMTVHEILGIRKATSGSQAAEFVDHFNRLIKVAVAALGNEGWVVVDTHVAQFVGHSLCDAGAPAATPQGDLAGSMGFPIWNFKKSRWEPASPTVWPPYRPKNRWFVTPNDAFLSGNYMNVVSGSPNPRDKIQPLFAATLSGAFHPNALGHATMADAVLPELRRALHLPVQP